MVTPGGTQELAKFDFTKQGRVLSANADHWQQWLDRLIGDFTEKWAIAAKSGMQLTATDQVALRFDIVRQRFPNPAIAWELTIGDDALPSILVMDRSLALALVLQLLGEEIDAIPDDRPLSDIEFSICEMLFRKITDSISESWPKKEQLACEMRRMDISPHRSRTWEPRTTVFTCSLNVKIGEDTRPIQWILPLLELEELLTQLDEERVEPDEEVKQKIKQRVFDIPVSVTVEIGRTQVPVARLAKLAEGDVLVFQRRISEPLPLLVDNKAKFFGWLGRSGSRQVFKISELPVLKNGSQ